MPRTIKGVAFDGEGTIVDVEQSVHHWPHLFTMRDVGVDISPYGLSGEKFTKLLNDIPHFIGGPDHEIAREIYALSRGKTSITEILAIGKKNSLRALKKVNPVIRPGFVRVLGALRGAGYKTAIGSLTRTDLVFKKAGLFEHFSAKQLVLRGNVKKTKPNPDVWLETARRMGIEPDEQVVFEDSPWGILGAAQVGAIGVGMPVYNHPTVIRALLEAGARRIFISWEEMDPVALIKNLERDT